MPSEIGVCRNEDEVLTDEKVPDEQAVHTRSLVLVAACP